MEAKKVKLVIIFILNLLIVSRLTHSSDALSKDPALLSKDSASLFKDSASSCKDSVSLSKSTRRTCKNTTMLSLRSNKTFAVFPRTSKTHGIKIILCRFFTGNWGFPNNLYIALIVWNYRHISKVGLQLATANWQECTVKLTQLARFSLRVLFKKASHMVTMLIRKYCKHMVMTVKTHQTRRGSRFVSAVLVRYKLFMLMQTNIPINWCLPKSTERV